MIQQETRLKVADNTGAKEILMIRNLSSRKAFAFVGDIIVATVKIAAPSGTVKKGDVVRAVIVRTKNKIKRKNGCIVQFNENAAVIINTKKLPIGTRIFGPISLEVKKRKFDKIISLVSDIV